LTVCATCRSAVGWRPGDGRRVGRRTQSGAVARGGEGGVLVAGCRASESGVVVTASMRQLGDAADVHDVGVAEADVGMIVQRGEALAQLHSPIILPNDEDDDEKSHGSEDAAEQVLGRDEPAPIFRRVVVAISWTSRAVAVSLISIVIGTVDFAVAPLHEIGLAIAVSALEPTTHSKSRIANAIAKTTPLVGIIGTLLIVNSRSKEWLAANEFFGGETHAPFSDASKYVVSEQ